MKWIVLMIIFVALFAWLMYYKPYHPKYSIIVAVELSDHMITSPMVQFQAHIPYTFVVHNASSENAHEFMVVHPLAIETMPTMHGMDDMDSLDKDALAMIDEKYLPPGATAEIAITFRRAYGVGSLELACHVTDHYEKGMKLGIVVTEEK